MPHSSLWLLVVATLIQIWCCWQFHNFPNYRNKLRKLVLPNQISCKFRTNIRIGFSCNQENWITTRYPCIFTRNHAITRETRTRWPSFWCSFVFSDRWRNTVGHLVRTSGKKRNSNRPRMCYSAPAISNQEHAQWRQEFQIQGETK